MAYVKDRLFTPPKGAAPARADDGGPAAAFPCESMATHLFDVHARAGRRPIEYAGRRCAPARVRFATSAAEMDVATRSSPRRCCSATRMLGWMTVCSDGCLEPESQWWRVVLIEAIARQAALALHHSRLVEHNRRRRAPQGDPRRAQPPRARHPRQPGAGLRRDPDAASGGAARACSACRRRSAAQHRHRGRSGAHAPDRGAPIGRRACGPTSAAAKTSPPRSSAWPISVSARPAVPIDLRRRRAAALRRRRRARDRRDRAGSADQRRAPLARRPDHDPRLHRAVGRAAALGGRRRPRHRARAVAASGFGMTSMQERADRIGASLTIVTAPRNGTEVVLAWEPASLPTQVHVARLTPSSAAAKARVLLVDDHALLRTGVANIINQEPDLQRRGRGRQRRRGDRRLRAPPARRDAARSADAGDGRRRGGAPDSRARPAARA